MAKDMLPLDQEMEAFGEEPPKPGFTVEDCKQAKKETSAEYSDCDT